MARRVLLPIAALAVAVAALAVLPAAFSQEDSEQDYLDSHNAAREEEGVGPVTWNSTLADYAQGYADERAGDCDLVHSYGPYGENLFWGNSRSITAYDVVGAWVSEKQFYDYESNLCAAAKECGHYTQVVWADTKAVGCGRVKCDDDDDTAFIVCSYDPPGNVEGQWPYAISA